ncbi:MAG: hypothetical protein DRR16_12540 [Candidatus Parabeggiatoa sp. nov. 3]|nr:MAG: hypothetical protein DRR00_18860 [Gammaproteobacteria bacterium]RKZ57171.1 MAG: hypothetical protein DRQ99_27360 [Gammaproteobacteria bacterium]RKZ85233.1 MAG: hypothetical protein DRR16_12540 [Gammaproteobacteria bacterium]
MFYIPPFKRANTQVRPYEKLWNDLKGRTRRFAPTKNCGIFRIKATPTNPNMMGLPLRFWPVLYL